jgi:hypothetical protein
MQRLAFEKLQDHPDILSRFNGDRVAFAVHRYAYYQCFRCKQPFFGGLYECVAAGQQDAAHDPSELLCSNCNPLLQDQCPTHGKEYMQFKCRFCCSVSVWFCFGTVRVWEGYSAGDKGDTDEGIGERLRAIP